MTPIEAIERSLDTLRVWLTICTCAVALGLVLEYKVLLSALVKLLLRIILSKSNSFERCAFRKMFTHSLGAVLVTVGVLGEFWIEFEQYWKEGELSVASAKEQTGLQLELQKQKERAATAEFNTAQAQQDLWLLSISSQQGVKDIANIVFEQSQRRFNDKAFLAELKSRPKARHVEVLYKRDNAEAWTLAFQLCQALGNSGPGYEGAGWNVSGPIPLPPSLGNEEPSEVRFGAAHGIGLVTRQRWNSLKENTPLDALSSALRAGLGRYASAGMSSGNDPSLPDGFIRVVVGQKW